MSLKDLDVEEEDVLGNFQQLNLTFPKMNTLEKQFMFISVAYVWLLCPSFLKFDWENIILQDVGILKYILYSAISNGRIVNAFLPLLNQTDLSRHMGFLQTLKRSMITTDDEVDMLENKYNLFQVELQHRTKLRLWNCEDTWFDRQRAVDLETKDDLSTIGAQSLMIIPTSITQTLPSALGNFKQDWKKAREEQTHNKGKRIPELADDNDSDDKSVSGESSDEIISGKGDQKGNTTHTQNKIVTTTPIAASGRNSRSKTKQLRKFPTNKSPRDSICTYCGFEYLDPYSKYPDPSDLEGCKHSEGGIRCTNYLHFQCMKKEILVSVAQEEYNDAQRKIINSNFSRFKHSQMFYQDHIVDRINSITGNSQVLSKEDLELSFPDVFYKTLSRYR